MPKASPVQASIPNVRCSQCIHNVKSSTSILTTLAYYIYLHCHSSIVWYVHYWQYLFLLTLWLYILALSHYIMYCGKYHNNYGNIYNYNLVVIVCDSSCVGLLIVQCISSRITAWSPMVGTPINQVRRPINQGLIKDLILPLLSVDPQTVMARLGFKLKIKDLILPLLSVDIWNGKRAGKKGEAAGNWTQGLWLSVPVLFHHFKGGPQTVIISYSYFFIYYFHTIIATTLMLRLCTHAMMMRPGNWPRLTWHSDVRSATPRFDLSSVTCRWSACVGTCDRWKQ